MESWREELYASGYDSEYLMHYRTKGSRNGISRTSGYTAIGDLAGRKRNPSGATGRVHRRGEALPLGDFAGEFEIGNSGLYESTVSGHPTRANKPVVKTTKQAGGVKNTNVDTAGDSGNVSDVMYEVHQLVDGIRNEKFSDKLKDYAAIAGDILKAVGNAKLYGTLSAYTYGETSENMYNEGVNKATKNLYDARDKIIRRRAKNSIQSDWKSRIKANEKKRKAYG